MLNKLQFPNLRLCRIFFEPDDGGGAGGAGGGGGDSLVSGAASPAPAAGDGAPSPTDDEINQKTDPFKDLEEFKDKETGLYFGRYKNTVEAFKGLREQDKELGRLKREKGQEAPEAYEPIVLDGEDIPEEYRGMELTEENDEELAYYLPIFKEAKLSQDQVAILAKAALKYGLKSAPDLKAEKQKLGEQAEAIISTVDNYVAKRNTPGASKLGKMAGTDAEALKELNALIQQSGEKPLPGDVGYGGAGKTWEDVRDEAAAYRKKHEDTFMSSPTQQATYQKMMQEMARLKHAAAKKR